MIIIIIITITMIINNSDNYALQYVHSNIENTCSKLF